MHYELQRLRQVVTEERKKSLERQQVMFELLRTAQRMSVEQTMQATKVWKDIDDKFGNFHDRVIPDYTQTNLDKGIAAVKHRRDREQIVKQKNVSRKEAEIMLKDRRLSDLNVWKDCVPLERVEKKDSSRQRRVITRRITKTLQQANQECKDAVNPLKKIVVVPTKTRDANAEVS